MTDVTRFHILAHIFISLTGALLLLAIWYNISERFKTILQEDGSPKRVDKGLLYLSLAIFVWVFSGGWAYLGNEFNFTETLYYRIGNNLFSIANDLFLFLALFYSDYAPKFIYKNEKNITKLIVVVMFMALSTWLIGGILGEHN